MFTTREINFEADTKQVVQLLKNEFGNRFTEDFFKWKHIENPFGISYGLVAVNEKEEIVGVRLFMWWHFIIGNQKKIAIRPVDTTTHKDYRGLGIFKKLTLAGIKELDGKYDLVFNTPNNNSLPGYLKMGWQKIDPDFDYYLNFYNPFFKKYTFDLITDPAKLPAELAASTDSTIHSKAFLMWRYKDADYKKAFFNNKSFQHLIIYKVLIKKVKALQVKMILVIDDAGNANNLKALINSICKSENAVCYYFLAYGSASGLKNAFSLKRGSSVVAYRSPNVGEVQSIQFSTGDLEGVL